jgi:hypothetical protein
MVFGKEYLREGQHFMAVVVGGTNIDSLYVGVSKPGLSVADGIGYHDTEHAWFMSAGSGSLWGNGKSGSDRAGPYEIGDEIGICLDLDEGSLQFFKNGVKHGPGWGAGSVTGQVLLAMQMYRSGQSGKLPLGKKGRRARKEEEEKVEKKKVSSFSFVWFCCHCHHPLPLVFH